MIIETLSVNSSDYKQIDGLYTKFTEKILDALNSKVILKKINQE